MKCEGVTMLKKCGVKVQRPANKRCGAVESRARFAVGLSLSSSLTVMLHGNIRCFSSFTMFCKACELI